MSPAAVVADALDIYGRPAWVAHVPARIRQQVPADELAALLAARPLELTIEQRYAAIVRWCSGVVFEEVTAQQVADVAGFSVETARRFMNDRTDLFRRISRSTFEVRDPEADRAADRR